MAPLGSEYVSLKADAKKRHAGLILELLSLLPFPSMMLLNPLDHLLWWPSKLIRTTASPRKPALPNT